MILSGQGEAVVIGVLFGTNIYFALRTFKAVKAASQLKSEVLALMVRVGELSVVAALKAEECEQLARNRDELGQWFDRERAVAAVVESDCKSYDYQVGQAKVAVAELLAIVEELKLEVIDLARKLAREKRLNSLLKILQDLVRRLHDTLANLDATKPVPAGGPR